MNDTPRPLVSVIISAYNYGHFISQALESIQEQTYENWECIVVDDESTDDTNVVVGSYAERDPRIKYIRQKNQGPSVARNTGIMNGKGKYVQFLDADDQIEPRKLEHHTMFLEQHSNVDIVYGNVRFFSADNPGDLLYSMWGGNKYWMPETTGGGEAVIRAFIITNIMVVNAPLIRRSAIDDVGLFDPALKGIEDWDYWIRCATHGKIFQYSDFEGSLALVRSHSTSISKDRRNMIKGGLQLRKKISQLRLQRENLKLNEELINRDEGLLALMELVYGSAGKGMKQLYKSLKTSGRKKWKLMLAGCAAISLILTREQFEKITRSSIAGNLIDHFRR
jgi:glycosyltransferase involved in cell wall biosynthesis